MASKLTKYRTEHTSVVALSEGAVLIGEEIAKQLHTNLLILLTENIFLPGEFEAIAGQTSANTFTYNNMFSPGQLEEYIREFHQFIDQKRLESFHRLNMMVGKDGEVKRELLRHHVVIIVSDGMDSGFSVDVAADFLKQIAIKKFVVAVSVSNVAAVDRMHLAADEIHCLSVAENYFGADHYYESNKLPDSKEVNSIMRNIALQWQQPTPPVAPANT